MRKVVTKVRPLLYFVALLVVSSILLYQCTSKDNEFKREYTGEEMFRSIYFLEGDFVSEIRTLSALKDNVSSYSLTPSQMAARQEMNDDLIKQINKLDPAFFERFKTQLASDNMYSLKFALTNGSKMMQAAGYASPKFSYVFKLSDKIKEKGVDMNREDIRKLDLTSEKDLEEFNKILVRDYGFDVKEEIYKSGATCNLGVWCAVTLAVAAQSVAAVWAYAVVAAVYLWVEVSGMNLEGEGLGRQEQLDTFVTELAARI